MPSLPLVTVITPTYNHENYIVECIQSVQAQTFRNWEMIIVNDGSTDKTSEVARNYIKGDDRIKIVDQENIGIFRLAETYNKALNLSQGKYVSILEGDDMWEPSKLEWQTSVLEQNGSVILAWGKAYSSTDDLSKNLYLSPDDKLTTIKYFNNKPVGSILNQLLIENCIPALTVTIRKEALNNIGGFIQSNDLPLIDISTLLKLAKTGEFFYDERPLGKWRTYARQITKTFPVEITKGRFDLCLQHFLTLNDNIKSNISVTEKDIRKHFDKLLQIAYARSGRYKLVRKSFGEARKDYKKAIFYKGSDNFTWRLRATIGYVFSLFHKDVEGVSRMLGKDTYRK
jgi:glycosyltransferase involved in cell wall biosynthesis